MSSSKLTAAIEALGKSKTAKALEKTFVALKDVATDDRLHDSIQSVKDLGIAMSPYLVPIQLLSAQIQAGTTKASVEMMQSLIKLLGTDTVQTTIRILTAMINTLILNTTVIEAIANNIDTFIDKLQELGEWLKNFFGRVKHMQEVIHGTNSMNLNGLQANITGNINSINQLSLATLLQRIRDGDVTGGSGNVMPGIPDNIWGTGGTDDTQSIQPYDPNYPEDEIS